MKIRMAKIIASTRLNIVITPSVDVKRRESRIAVLVGGRATRANIPQESTKEMYAIIGYLTATIDCICLTCYGFATFGKQSTTISK
jgi:hypothetical protein